MRRCRNRTGVPEWSPMVAEEPQAELTRRLVDWRPDHIGTLTFLHQHGRVLLMRKKRGHGAGKINGPGGKLESGETP